MLNRDKVLNQLIPILRPLLSLNSTELSTYRLVKSPTDCSRPNNPYSTISIVQMQDLGTMEYGEIISDVGLQNKKHYELLIRINSFYKDSCFRLDKLKSNMENPDLLDQLTANGFGYKDSSAIKDLSALNTTKYGERFRIDLSLYASSGCLETFEEVPEEDKGKAGKGNFFDLDPVESVNVVSFSGFPIEQTSNIDNEE